MKCTTARLVSQRGRRRSSYPESENCFPVFLEQATGCLDRFPVGLIPAPALIPSQPAGHGFTAPSASGRTGSRTGLPHCIPQRHGGMDRARDWPRLPESKGYPGIIEAPEPLIAPALSPKLSLEPVYGRGSGLAQPLPR